MEWGAKSVGRESRRFRRSRSRSLSVESRDSSSGRRSSSFQSQLKRHKRSRELQRPLSRSSDSDYNQDLKEYANRKQHKKRNKSIDQSALPSEVSLDKLSKVMASLVPNSTGKPDMAPDFDPEDRTVTSETWCRKMDDLKVIFNWSDESTIYFAASKLRGVANAWYNGLPNRQYIWAEFKDKLQSAFPSKRNYYELLQQMMARRKLGNEKYVTYYYDKLSLLKACNITGEDAVSCIVAGITDQVVRYGAEAADFNGLEALLGYMTAVESVPGSSKEIDRKERKFINNKAGPSSKSNPVCYICGLDDHYSHKCPQQPIKKSSTSCFNCGSDGHFAKDCRNAGRCFRCGGDDHFVINCPQSKPTPSTTSTSSPTCYMCGIEGHIAQFCPDAYKIRGKSCFICHKRGHLAIACPSSSKYPPIRCNYCGKIGHLEEGCFNKMDDTRYGQPEQPAVVGRNVIDPYDVYEDLSREDDGGGEFDNVGKKVESQRQNGQDGFLSEGELGSEHSN